MHEVDHKRGGIPIKRMKEVQKSMKSACRGLRRVKWGRVKIDVRKYELNDFGRKSEHVLPTPPLTNSRGHWETSITNSDGPNLRPMLWEVLQLLLK